MAVVTQKSHCGSISLSKLDLEKTKTGPDAAVCKVDAPEPGQPAPSESLLVCSLAFGRYLYAR